MEDGAGGQGKNKIKNQNNQKAAVMSQAERWKRYTCMCVCLCVSVCVFVCVMYIIYTYVCVCVCVSECVYIYNGGRWGKRPRYKFSKVMSSGIA